MQQTGPFQHGAFRQRFAVSSASSGRQVTTTRTATTTSTSITSTSRTSTSVTETSHTSTSMTFTTTGLFPLAPFSCLRFSIAVLETSLKRSGAIISGGLGPRGDMNLGPVKHPDKKGIALDDTTFSQCPSLTTVQWPNAKETWRSDRTFPQTQFTY